MEYRAYFGRIGTNPFAVGSRMTITTDLPDGISQGEVERLAKEATPTGFEFIRVERKIKPKCSFTILREPGGSSISEMFFGF